MEAFITEFESESTDIDKLINSTGHNIYKTITIILYKIYIQNKLTLYNIKSILLCDLINKDKKTCRCMRCSNFYEYLKLLIKTIDNESFIIDLYSKLRIYVSPYQINVKMRNDELIGIAMNLEMYDFIKVLRDDNNLVSFRPKNFIQLFKYDRFDIFESLWSNRYDFDKAITLYGNKPQLFYASILYIIKIDDKRYTDHLYNIAGVQIYLFALEYCITNMTKDPRYTHCRTILIDKINKYDDKTLMKEIADRYELVEIIKLITIV